MKKLILILMLGVIFSGFIQAEKVTQSTEIAKKSEPKLLWTKEFDGEIKSFAASYDGKYIAVGVDKSKLNKDKSEYIYTKTDVVLLNKLGKEIGKKEIDIKLGLIKLGNKRAFIVASNYRKLKVFDFKEKIIWETVSPGIPMISPEDNYIATIDDGTGGDSSAGLKVYDVNGNLLWKYNPEKFCGATFLGDDKIVFISFDDYGSSIYKDGVMQKIEKTRGALKIFTTSSGEVIYETIFEIPFPIYLIVNIDIDTKKNIIDLLCRATDTYKNIIINLPSNLVATGNIQKESLSSNKLYPSSNKGAVYRDTFESDSFILKKLNNKEIGFYTK